jgi:hypothetical protein
MSASGQKPNLRTRSVALTDRQEQLIEAAINALSAT